MRDAYGKDAKLRCWETNFKHHSGKPVPVECTISPLKLNGEQDGSVIAFRDISNQKMLEEKLRWQATHDHLTNLYNRRYFENHLEKEIRDSQRTGIMGAMIYIDLDRFKYVNDTAGHETGDRMLLEITSSLVHRQRLPGNNLVSRVPTNHLDTSHRTCPLLLTIVVGLLNTHNDCTVLRGTLQFEGQTVFLRR